MEEIKRKLEFIRDHAVGLLGEIENPSGEGCPVMEGLLELQTVINAAVDNYYGME